VTALAQLARRPSSLPAPLTLHAADLAEARVRLELLRHGADERLKAMREPAIAESVGSAGRLDGLEVDAARLCTILLGNPLLLDASERQARGLRDAFLLVSERGSGLPLTEPTLRRLHRMVGGGGRSRREVESAEVEELLGLARQCLEDRWVVPEIVAAALELDVAALRPFGAESGRMSLLALQLALAHAGSDVGGYVSLPRLTEDSRERYQAVLDESARGYQDGWEDPWPFLLYRLVVLKTAYGELRNSLGHPPKKAGTKAELVRAAVEAAEGRVTLAGLMRSCPGVSERTIQNVLRRMKGEGKLSALGRGPGTPWERPGS